jgi:hypothetical protein
MTDSIGADEAEWYQEPFAVPDAPLPCTLEGQADRLSFSVTVPSPLPPIRTPNTNPQRSLSGTPTLAAFCVAAWICASPKPISCSCTSTNTKMKKYFSNLHCKSVIHAVGEIIYIGDMGTRNLFISPA